MAKNFIAPGVFVEEISKLPPSISPVETAIPAFIGYTFKADNVLPDDLKLKPFRISSLTEYVTYFGGPQKETGIIITINETQINGITTNTDSTAPLPDSARSKYLMYYALQLFFANGGGACWIVSVAKYKPKCGSLPATTKLLAGLSKLKEADEPTLIIFPDAQNLGIADFKKVHDSALLQCAVLGDRFVIMDIHGDTESLSDPDCNVLTAINNFRTNGIGEKNLKYGAAYAPNIVTTLEYSVDEFKTKVIRVLNGLASPATNLETLKAVDPKNYKVAEKAILSLSLILPPSAAIAGIFASVDASRGVWKAPANISLNAVSKPVIKLTKLEQDQMNIDASAGKSVNAICTFTGKGTLVWGARTLAGNDNEWRYINVRRFFNFVTESVKKGTEQFVFEPNDAATWARIKASIENFLINIWQQGALQGNTPDHAFFVAVGLGITMTALDILEGRLIVEIGLAAVRPAEFIILRFSHKMVVP
jgi:hypothetical protein